MTNSSRLPYPPDSKSYIPKEWKIVAFIILVMVALLNIYFIIMIIRRMQSEKAEDDNGTKGQGTTSTCDSLPQALSPP